VQIGVEATDIIELVATACRRNPTLTAIAFEDGAEISRAEFKSAIERFAGHLAHRIAPGDHVAIISENRIEFMVAWLAVVANGGVLVSLNPTSGPHDAGHVLRDSRSAVVIVTESTLGLLERIRGDVPELREVITVRAEEPRGLEEYEDGPPLNLDRVRVDAAAATNVYYTSGTTGQPKGCRLGHSYWLRFVNLWLGLYGMGPGDRLMCCVPFFYGDAPWELLTSLQVGSTWVAMRRFSVSRFWEVIRANRVTQLFTLASMPALLLKAPPAPRDRDHSIRFAVHVGIPPALHRQMHERWGFPWVEGYGLTETGLVIAMPLELSGTMTGSGSIGIPCPGADVRLLDDRGDEVDAGVVGEVVVRAPGMMHDYLNQPEATAERLQAGWLHTGDLARSDERGLFYFLGRKKDIVRRSGENVSAAEVEEVLRAHPSVRDAAVIPMPDEIRGEEVKAFIEPATDQPPDALAEQVVEFCLEHLARHKVPRYVEIRSVPLPRTASMRVNKAALRPGSGGGVNWDREQELGW
jgi:crotonobetaine/carnitine-CoA ligase